eukprot:gnl/TRDRNA2_/TRDRNA2_176469_c0_seq3.p1 gnl/TRDRNA2_/TRDRNA2_176469_c0~~gnl/TRDRNA2_/TRDRNA2_176469_c0_seq3.p1  ORF type:complete len:246 (+),score=30.83 gnl/TRDRNA2_/TRDRNA2_176469_c0_seq3:109-738(+)
MPASVIVLACLVGLVAAQGNKGNPGCPCIGYFHPDCITRVACADKPYKDSNGECIQPTVQGEKKSYPTNYGTICQKHMEPGHTDCYDTAAGTELPAPDSGADKVRAGWCDDPWCYIDPCNCNAPSQYKSDYFPDSLFYTYLTCGDEDTYSGAADGSSGKEADGNTCLDDCFKKDMPAASSGSTDEVSGTEPVKPILSMIGLLFLAAMRW